MYSNRLADTAVLISGTPIRFTTCDFISIQAAQVWMDLQGEVLFYIIKIVQELDKSIDCGLSL